MRAAILEQEQFDTLYAFAANMKDAPQYTLMLLLTQKLGLRPVEIANMESNWFNDHEIRIPQGSSKRQGSRSLPVNEVILNALQEHMGNRTGRVFRNAKGDAFTPNGISEALRRIYRLAGVRGSAYSGRRTAATNMVDRGVNIKVVQSFLGHQNLATTAAYCEVTPNMLRRAVFG